MITPPITIKTTFWSQRRPTLICVSRGKNLLEQAAFWRLAREPETHFWSSLLSLRREATTGNTSAVCMLQAPWIAIFIRRPGTDAARSSFGYRGERLWNGLPNEIIKHSRQFLPLKINSLRRLDFDRAFRTCVHTLSSLGAYYCDISRVTRSNFAFYL